MGGNRSAARPIASFACCCGSLPLNSVWAGCVFPRRVSMVNITTYPLFPMLHVCGAFNFVHSTFAYTVAKRGMAAEQRCYTGKRMACSCCGVEATLLLGSPSSAHHAGIHLEHPFCPHCWLLWRHPMTHGVSSGIATMGKTPPSGKLFYLPLFNNWDLSSTKAFLLRGCISPASMSLSCQHFLYSRMLLQLHFSPPPPFQQQVHLGWRAFFGI